MTWSQLCSTLEVCGAVGVFLLVPVVVWLKKAVSQRGILKPRFISGSKARGLFVNFGPADTHYAIFGGKEGQFGPGQINSDRLVIYLHGLGAQLEQLTWGVDEGLSRALVDAGYTVLSLDLYGHGFSEAPDTDLAPSEFVDQLKALLSHLRISSPFDLIGFSHGCFIASAYAAGNPNMVKHLVLTSPFGCDLPCHSSSVVAGLAALVVHLFFRGNMNQIRTTYRIVQHLEGHKFPSILNSLETAGTRALIIAGAWEIDPVMGILRTARKINNALTTSTLHVVPRGTHNTWSEGSAEQQREIRRILVAYLQDEPAIGTTPGPETSLLRHR